MRIDRRGFLRLVGGAALAPARRAGAAAAGAPAIHTRTRNTPLGALGGRRTPLDEAGPFKPYPGRERTSLPVVAADATPSLAQVLAADPAPGFAAEPVPLESLARVLQLGNGVTGRLGRTLLRAAPSAGALYAGEVYVVAERVQGLAPGVYSFSVPDAALVRLAGGSGAARAGAALEHPARAEAAAAWVILTNVFRRYGVRYRNRGYRYALIDSGHIGENLRLAARAEGLAHASPLRFEDALLTELLGIDGRDEAVCAVHVLGRPGPAVAGAPGRRLVERQWVEPEGLPASGPLTLRYHAATALVPGGPAPPDAPPQTPLPDAPAPETPLPGRFSLSLEPARSADAPLAEVIRRRRSAMHFEAKPVAKADLAGVLAAASTEPAPGLEIYVVAHRVEGVASGLYRLEPGAGRLAGLHRRDLRVALIRACGGQRKAGRAAVAVLMAARFQPTASGLGSRRYRDQLLAAGAIAQRIYLAAEALGLAARNLAAFLDDDLNVLAGLDPDRAGVVHLTVFGPGD